MRTNSMIKTTLTIVLLLVLLVSCKEKDKNPTNTEVETLQEEVIVKKNQLIGDPFSTLKTSYYDNKGVFYREILMPTEKLSNGQRDASYDLKIKFQKDISSDGNYILFELYQHGNPEKKEMLDNLVTQHVPIISKSSITNFDASLEKYVYVFSYHDEDFLTYSPQIKKDIFSFIKNRVKECVNINGKNCRPLIDKNDIIKIINPKIINKNKPNTIGGGVVPPK